jgi:hypothetical protein
MYHEGASVQAAQKNVHWGLQGRHWNQLANSDVSDSVPGPLPLLPLLLLLLPCCLAVPRVAEATISAAAISKHAHIRSVTGNGMFNGFAKYTVCSNIFAIYYLFLRGHYAI